MTHTTSAVLVFGMLFAFVIIMFWIERRTIAKRKLNGTFVDISDILLKRSKSSTEKHR